jgi:hypothetical protein
MLPKKLALSDRLSTEIYGVPRIDSFLIPTAERAKAFSEFYGLMSPPPLNTQTGLVILFLFSWFQQLMPLTKSRNPGNRRFSFERHEFEVRTC